MRRDTSIPKEEGNHISIRDYAIRLKLSGLSWEKAIDKVERLAIEAGVEKIYVQTGVVLKVYLDKSIKVRKHRYVRKQHTEKEWEDKKNQYNNRCVYCGKKDIKLTKDHVIPISSGGSDKIENIVPACWPCNFKKRARKLEYFLEDNNITTSLI